MVGAGGVGAVLPCLQVKKLEGDAGYEDKLVAMEDHISATGYNYGWVSV